MNRKTIDYFKVKNRKIPETQLQNSLFYVYWTYIILIVE
jgi:hypothetical protein